jgi:hypothetical protein
MSRSSDPPFAPAPPPSAALRALVHAATPVAPRQPRVRAALAALVAVVAAAVVVASRGARPDVAHLPRAWFWPVACGWLAAFVAATTTALVPRRGAVFPDVRRARWAALAIPVLGVGGGMLLTRDVPPFTAVPHGLAEHVERAWTCGVSGAAVIATTLVAGGVAMRGAAMPVDARWVGACLGAAGGALAELVLHVHCGWGGATHVGAVHGAVVVLGVAIGASTIPRRVA